MIKNKINFKQPKYVLPALAFPFILLILYFVGNFTERLDKPAKDELTKRGEISTELGVVNENVEIKDKQDAYRDFYDKRVDGKTLIGNMDQEEELLESYGNDYTDSERRTIDSLKFVKQKEKLNGLNNKAQDDRNKFAIQDLKRQKESQKREDEEYERSMKMLEMLNGKRNQANNSSQNEPVQKEQSLKEEQLSLMREQMMLLDSIEKANNPELRAQAVANENLKQSQKELEAYLNSTFRVTKNVKSSDFNSVYRENESSFIKAVIDENTKGYLGSRIRFRLLEDVYISDIRVKKGTILYGLISGFTLQRVNISIVSIMYQNEILPINLTIYDVDGMEGLYVPQSVFREMSRTMAQNTVQGQNIGGGNADFFTNTLTSMFQSTSKSIADLIRKNKVKVKYNSYVYLIDNQELQKKRKDLKPKRK